MLGSVLQVESNRQLEIKLNCATLVFPSKSIEQFGIDFGTIESPVSFVYFVLFSKFF